MHHGIRFLGPPLFNIRCNFIFSNLDDTWPTPFDTILKRTEIVELFSYIEKEILDHALAGYNKPLMKNLGPSPEQCLSRLSDLSCKEKKHCIMHDPKLCKPKLGMKFCFNLDDDALINDILQGWSDNIYWVVIKNGRKSPF
jgi:hypothetical protein